MTKPDTIFVIKDADTDIKASMSFGADGSDRASAFVTIMNPSHDAYHHDGCRFPAARRCR